MGKFTKTIEVDIGLTRKDIEEYLKDAIKHRRDFDEFSKMTGIIDIICHDEFRYEDGVDMIEEHFAEIIKRARAKQMKSFDELFDGVIKHEGYYANVDGDRGGETYMGVARNLHPDWEGWQFIDAYKETYGKIPWNKHIDILELNCMVKEFYCHTFYEKFRIGDISNGSLQEIIFDWCVNSGHWGAGGVQRVLNQFFDADLKMDGIIGNQTLSVINSCEPRTLFIAIHRARVRYYHSISKKGKNHLFLEGWLKRIGSIEFDD